MEAEITLRDIADDLLILNKYTIDALFQLENCADCIALYALYYKTAKWQKTNTIKANDLYVKKVLKWGIDRIKRTKQTLKEHGLINIVQRRKDGKIAGWYIEVSYLVTQRKEEDIRIKVVESNNTQNQHVENSTCGNEETNALKQQVIALKNENKMLKNKNNNDQPAKPADSVLAAEFEELWKQYPRKQGKTNALKAYVKARKAGIDKQTIQDGITAYNEQIKANNTNIKYVKQGSTWFGQHCWDDEYSITNSPTRPKTKQDHIDDEWLNSLE